MAEAAVSRAGAHSYESRLVAVLALVGGVAALDGQAVFYIMPFIAPELKLSNAQIGPIGSAVLIGWSVSAVVGGSPATLTLPGGKTFTDTEAAAIASPGK